MKLLRSIYSSPTYSNKLIVLRIIIFDATINNYSNKVLEGILISSITKSPLMVITLNTRRVKAVYRLDSKPSKPANSREIYRLVVDRPFDSRSLRYRIYQFFYDVLHARHRWLVESGSKGEERKGARAQGSLRVYTNIYTFHGLLEDVISAIFMK